MSEITLTQDQQIAYEAFNQFVLDPLRKVFVLSGFAGTGKSTLVNKLLEDLPKLFKTLRLIDPKDDRIWDMKLTATTNKAAEALQSITGQEVGTIHSTLGLTVKKEYSTGESTLVIRKGAQPLENYLLFIDEASYIDPTLLKLIFKMTQHCKLVFIGDPAQLAPVKSKGTPVFENGYPGAKLSEVVRQAKGSPIMDAATTFRNWVNTGDLEAIQLDGHHLQWLQREEFEQKIVSEFTRPDWKYGDSKILAWTNKRVVGYNNGLRVLVQGNPEFQPGDYAVCNSYVSSDGIRIATDSLVHINTIIPAREWSVAGYLVKLNDSPKEFFMPKDFADKKRRMAQAKKEGEDYLVRMIDQQWIDLRAAYACTINKSQGSTYDQVFIDLDDIKRCNSGDQIARMLYVAVSRARHHVYFTGDLV